MTARLTRWEAALCAFAVLSWMIFYTGGTVIGTEVYRQRLNAEDLDLFDAFKCWSIILACYTITNVCALTCLAALLGGIYRVATDRVADNHGLETTHDPAAREPAVLGIYGASLIQGFVVFLALSSGLFLLGDHPFLAPTQEKYVSLATLASLVGFLSAAQPLVFTSLIDAVTQRMPHPEESPEDDSRHTIVKKLNVQKESYLEEVVPTAANEANGQSEHRSTAKPR